MSDFRDRTRFLHGPRRWLATALLLAGLCGCSLGFNREVPLPDDEEFSREQLRIRSDIKLPRNHRLIDEIVARRRDISGELLLPLSDEPIHVYIFQSADDFHAYIRRNHADFPDRRALFVRNDTTLNVYAWWGEHVGDDLRHEVTHGYLHSVVPNLPLWLDEGLAEYFERPRGQEAVHEEHVAMLVEEVKNSDWSPDLKALESLRNPAAMTQLQYAESWLWVNYLLRSGEVERRLLQDQLARLRMKGDTEPLSRVMGQEESDHASRILDHLGTLAAAMSP